MVQRFRYNLYSHIYETADGYYSNLQHQTFPDPSDQISQSQIMDVLIITSDIQHFSDN